MRSFYTKSTIKNKQLNTKIFQSIPVHYFVQPWIDLFVLFLGEPLGGNYKRRSLAFPQSNIPESECLMQFLIIEFSL